MLGSLLIAAMKLRHRDAELAGRSTHLIHRDEAGVDVAGRVFQSLRHHRAGELLELQREVQLLAVAVHRRVAVIALQQQDAAQEIEDRRSHGFVAPFGASNRLLDVAAVAFADVAALVDVGAVDREAGDGFANGLAQDAAA